MDNQVNGQHVTAVKVGQAHDVPAQLKNYTDEGPLPDLARDTIGE